METIDPLIFHMSRLYLINEFKPQVQRAKKGNAMIGKSNHTKQGIDHNEPIQGKQKYKGFLNWYGKYDPYHRTHQRIIGCLG